MLLGYIISEDKIKVDNFKNLSSLDSIDKPLPKLYVGRNFVKSLGIKTSILSKKISSDSFWTFSSKEKKSEFNDDLEIFKKLCINNFLNNLKYYYIDPFTLKYSTTKKLINKLNSTTNGLYYFNDKMFYVYFDNLTLGVNIDTIEYVGISKEKIINLLKSNNFNTLPKDEIFNDCMDLVKEFDNIKILPHLYHQKKYDK